MSDQNTTPLPEPEPESHADRLLDLALTEKLGGRKPTDVQEKVLAALGPVSSMPGNAEVASAGPANPAAAPQPAKRGSPRLSWEHYSLLAAVCAGILITVSLLSLPQQYRNVAWITGEPLRKAEIQAGAEHKAATPANKASADREQLDQDGKPAGSEYFELHQSGNDEAKSELKSNLNVNGGTLTVTRDAAAPAQDNVGTFSGTITLREGNLPAAEGAIQLRQNSFGDQSGGGGQGGDRPGFGGRAPAANEGVGGPEAKPQPGWIAEQFRGANTRSARSYDPEQMSRELQLQDERDRGQSLQGLPQQPADSREANDLPRSINIGNALGEGEKRLGLQSEPQPTGANTYTGATTVPLFGNAIDESKRRQADGTIDRVTGLPATRERMESRSGPAGAAEPASKAPAPGDAFAPAPRPVVTSVVPVEAKPSAAAPAEPAPAAPPAPPGAAPVGGKNNLGVNDQAAPAKVGGQVGRGEAGNRSVANGEAVAPANKPASAPALAPAPAGDPAAKGAAAATAAPMRAAEKAADALKKVEESTAKELKDADVSATGKGKDQPAEDRKATRAAQDKQAEAKTSKAKQEPDVTIDLDPNGKLDAAKMPVEKSKLDEGAAKKAAAPTWKRAKATPNASQLMVGDNDGLPLVGLTTSVQIDGFRARVVSDYYFYNDKGRRLEGNFKLRLPNEAALYYFAFGETTYKYEPQLEPLAQASFANADGKARAAAANPADIFRLRSDSWVANTVKEARMVPREQAAYAYAEATRRRVDPAIVEWSGAGIFQTRVFPLDAGKLHRVVVGYDVNVAHEGDDLVYRFDVPEDHGQCSVDINLAALPGRTAKVQPAQDPFFANNRAFYHFDKLSPDQASLEVRIEKPGALALSGSDAQAGKFFAAEVTPNLAAGVAGDKESKENAAVGSEYGLFLLDTSLSSQPERFNIYLKLLEETLTRNRESLKHFGLLVFNVETHWWQEKYVENTPENTKAALDYCNSLALEGATDLSAAFQEAAHPSWPVEGKQPAADVFLLSDGNATWGELNAHLLARTLAAEGVRSLFAYNSGTSGTAVGLLDHLTRETGGSVFAVTSEEEIAKAATAHRQRPWQLLSVTVPEGSDVLMAGRPKTIYAGQRLTVVGRGELKAGSEIILHVKRGEEQKAVHAPIDLVVPTDVAARTYGQVATAQLESMASLTQDVAVAYARHFRVTGETCSLLMLESEADYQRYNIKPEDDAFVVKSSPAAELLTKKLDELAKQLVEPKAALLAWLGRLERIPGVQFRTSTALKLALEKMPAKSFEVAVPRLEGKDRERVKLPQEYLKQLEQPELSYDAVNRDAQRRLEALGSADALKALSSLIENSPGDMVLTRDVAFSALEWKLGGQAYHLLRRAAMARPYEPQTYLALGRCLAELGKVDLAIVYYETALAGTWDGRFGEFPRIAQVEYLHLLRRIHSQELKCSVPEFAEARFDSLVKESGLAGADLVVIMQWNTDRSDVDLHVTEPSGELCKYDHATTAAGGHITRDVTQGFGPEMYSIRQAPAGKYTVAINYYGSDANRAQARSKIYVNVYEYFGTDREQVTTKAITLSENKELREVLQVNVKK